MNQNSYLLIWLLSSCLIRFCSSSLNIHEHNHKGKPSFLPDPIRSRLLLVWDLLLAGSDNEVFNGFVWISK